MARPRIQIDWKQFDALCTVQCTLEEIAAFFNCSVDTIERACKREYKVGFAEYASEKRRVGRISLRRVQWQTAMSGNVTMQIFLGKNYLGQSDRVMQVPSPPGPMPTPEQEREAMDATIPRMAPSDA